MRSAIIERIFGADTKPKVRALSMPQRLKCQFWYSESLASIAYAHIYDDLQCMNLGISTQVTVLGISTGN